MPTSLSTATSTTTKMVFSINTELAEKIKAEIPARKRSEFIENLVRERFYHDKKQKGWEAMQAMRQKYNRDEDPIKLSAVEWVRKDRQNH